ncbi:sulfite exporter TauE/SafE family protein [bacterium]|nr:sulfite exporter TauE/SafE family protein [bacterium]
MTAIVPYILLGLAAGVASGFLGIGGGLLLVPAMTLIFGFTQHQAQGTSLAVLIPPVGLLAAWTYYRAGHVNVKIAGLICIGFILGALAGSRAAVSVPNDVLRRVFGAFLIAAGVFTILKK